MFSYGFAIEEGLLVLHKLNLKTVYWYISEARSFCHNFLILSKTKNPLLFSIIISVFFLFFTSTDLHLHMGKAGHADATDLTRDKSSQKS